VSRINHVSIHARDLQESEDFYVELLGAEPIPSPNFGLPVRWLAFGRTQLHLFERDVEAPGFHHFGLTVDDLEPVYRAAERLGALEPRASGNHSSSCRETWCNSTSVTPSAISSRSTTSARPRCRTTCALT